MKLAGSPDDRANDYVIGLEFTRSEVCSISLLLMRQSLPAGAFSASFVHRTQAKLIAFSLASIPPRAILESP